MVINMNKNIHLNINLLDTILSNYDLHTNNYNNYLLAFTHSTYANEHNLVSNERIEFLGDALLGMCVAEYIYNTFPNMTEGLMTKLRMTYVCEEANHNYAKRLKLDEMLLLGVGEEQTGGRLKKAVIADTFECFLGATYLTFGYEAVKKVLSNIVFPDILETDNIMFVDYKSKLQEYIQADNQNTVEYVLIKEEGKPNEKVFTIAVKLDGVTLGIGTGTSKKNAGQEAAKDALSKMVK